ncbi:MAG: hypothetical protein SFV81_20015 [Pirellulaceae bacterium]|nr:hypothetical protein [Pirellulaceae bacterium]
MQTHVKINSWQVSAANLIPQTTSHMIAVKLTSMGRLLNNRRTSVTRHRLLTLDLEVQIHRLVVQILQLAFDSG